MLYKPPHFAETLGAKMTHINSLGGKVYLKIVSLRRLDLASLGRVHINSVGGKVYLKTISLIFGNVRKARRA